MKPISSMPNNFQFSVDTLTKRCVELYNNGVKSVLLFNCYLTPNYFQFLVQEGVEYPGFFERIRLLAVIQDVSGQAAVADHFSKPFNTLKEIRGEGCSRFYFNRDQAAAFPDQQIDFIAVRIPVEEQIRSFTPVEK